MLQDFLFYLSEGWHHMTAAGALDHMLFVAVLAVVHVPREWKRLLVLVTAFTVGHALTLVLSVLDVVRFPDVWVEFAIPCTIAATAAANLFRQDATQGQVRVRYAMALLFGLVHGMGFANTVRFMLADGQSLSLGLLGFNTGLEIGQIFVVLSILLTGELVTRVPGMSRPRWVMLVSSCVLVLSMWMAWDRFPR